MGGATQGPYFPINVDSEFNVPRSYPSDQGQIGAVRLGEQPANNGPTLLGEQPANNGPTI